MMKRCPQCGSDELDSEPSAEPMGCPQKLVDAISYVCRECGCEFSGVSGSGVHITYEGLKEV